MLPENPVIAIIGAGALGSYYGARLAQHGRDVHFLLRSDYEAVKGNGLTIKSVNGDFRLAANAIHVYKNPEEMPAADLAIVTLKSTANGELPRLLGPVLKPSTVLLTLQNGLGNEAALARLVPPTAVVGGVAFVCINRTAPGCIEHTAHGLIKIGEYADGAEAGRLEKLAGMFHGSGIQCEVLPSLLRGRWEKLLWNIPFNGLSAALDRTTDQLLATEAGRELVRGIMREVIVAARAERIVIEAGMIEMQIERTRAMGAYFTSSHVDRLQGRALELEALFGLPVEAARRGGVQVPMMEMLYRALCVVDGGRESSGGA